MPDKTKGKNASTMPPTGGIKSKADRTEETRKANVLKILCDPTRIAIIEMLAKSGQKNVKSISEELGGLSQPATSHHIAVLYRAGAVKVDRDGQSNWYELSDYGVALAGILPAL